MVMRDTIKVDGVIIEKRVLYREVWVPIKLINGAFRNNYVGKEQVYTPKPNRRVSAKDKARVMSRFTRVK